MNIVIFSGSHPRHLYVVNKIMETGLVRGIVLMKREGMIESPPNNLSGHIKDLYKKHFNLRLEMENQYFEQSDVEKIAKEVPILQVSSAELNGGLVESFMVKISADCLFSYGPDLIHENILSKVNSFAFNLHGGLSPWYKGAATMFWPFYFLEPNYVGTTLHYITQKIDAGNIVHQTVPELSKGDCMHAVACKAIIAAADDVKEIFTKMGKGVRYLGKEQKKNGKLFLNKDWRPEHLRLIYDTYEDKIVDLYLDGEICVGNEPDLVMVDFGETSDGVRRKAD